MNLQPIVVPISVDAPITIQLSVDSPDAIDLTSGVVIGAGGPPYEGAYEATPTQYEQVFQTGWKTLGENFTVHPIPSNYGLITYNGFELNVS